MPASAPAKQGRGRVTGADREAGGRQAATRSVGSRRGAAGPAAHARAHPTGGSARVDRQPARDDLSRRLADAGRSRPAGPGPGRQVGAGLDSRCQPHRGGARRRLASGPHRARGDDRRPDACGRRSAPRGCCPSSRAARRRRCSPRRPLRSTSKRSRLPAFTTGSSARSTTPRFARRTWSATWRASSARRSPCWGSRGCC